MDKQKLLLEHSSEGSSYAITKSHCRITTGVPNKVDRDSSHVQSSDVSQYKWETRLYPGRMIAVHRDAVYAAYVLNLGKSGAAVRITNRLTKARVTIKGFSGNCTDIAWASGTAKAMLGTVDEQGNVFVYTCEDLGPGSEAVGLETFISIRRADGVPNGLRLLGLTAEEAAPRNYRLAWCPYVPDASAEEEKEGEEALSTMLAVFQGPRVDILMLDSILESLGGVRETTFAYVATHLKAAAALVEEKSDILTACISPDATALALGTQGGLVKFYILENMEEVRCAHEWPPHCGADPGRPRPVHSLLFLDNLQDIAQGTQDQFWKFALTATDDNRELKLWNCEDWSAMGTLELEPAPGKAEGWGLGLRLDWTGRFLLLTDIERKALYVVELGEQAKGSEMGFKRISEFPLHSPVLDASIVNFHKPTASQRGSPALMAGDNSDCIKAEIIAVTPKSIVEMEVRWDLEAERKPTPRRTVSTDSDSSARRGRASGGRDSEPRDSSQTSSKRGKRRVVKRPTPPVTPDPGTPSPTPGLSPTSAEIQGILEGSGDEEAASSSSDEAATSLRPPPQPDRPVSPVVHSLVSRDNFKKDSSVKRSAGNSSKLRGRPAPKRQPHQQTINVLPSQEPIGVDGTWDDADSGGAYQTTLVPPAGSATPRMEVVATVPNELVDSISKTGMELERVVAHLARQEEELKALREAQKEAGRNMNRIGERMRDNMNSGFRAVEGGIRGKSSEDLKAMETRLKADMRSVIHSQMGDDAKRLELSINDRLGSSVERAVGTELGKALKNKATVVAIGRVVAESVASEVAAGCKSEFTMSIVPTFKHSTTNLFTQLNQVFQKGIKDYIEQLEKQAGGVVGSSEESRKALESRLEEMGRETREMSQLHLQQMSTSLQNQLELSVDTIAKKIMENTTSSLKTVMKEELATLSAQMSSASLRSGAGTPSVSGTPGKVSEQRQLALLVQQKDINGAFQLALNACDLELLCFLLSKMEPKALFAKNPLPLSQPVLLSLLHQLAAADLRKDTEVKLKYIDETLGAVDETSPEVHKFLPKIVADLNDRIKQFKESRPQIPAPLNRLLRKIEVTCQSF